MPRHCMFIVDITEKNVLQVKGMEIRFISIIKYAESDDFEDSGGAEALHGFCSLCCGTSAMAYSAAIKDQ